MKIFTAKKIRQCDEFTIANEPVSSIQLMERAAQSCVNWFLENCKVHKKITIFCGNGNNGGDGLAIARLLYLKGFDVDVFDCTKTDKVALPNLVTLLSGKSVFDTIQDILELPLPTRDGYLQKHSAPKIDVAISTKKSDNIKTKTK